MQKIRLTSLIRPNSLNIIKLQRRLKIIKTSPNFQVSHAEKINGLEQNKVDGDSKNVVLRKVEPCGLPN